VAGNQISEEASIVKDKELVAQNVIHSSDSAKSYFKRKPTSPPKSPLVPKQPGFQLKSGSVFCLPAKSSHSSRIIIPNKRFLDDDCHHVNISPPKKPKVEHVSVDVKKGSTVTVPSTYRCSKKEVKSDSDVTASAVPCKPDIRTKDSEVESSETKLCSSDVDTQDVKLLGSENKPKIASTETVENDSLKTKSASSTGSILQKPKLCLDQTAVDRSKVEFAKSLRSQMSQDNSRSELLASYDPGSSSSSLPASAVATSLELRSISTTARSSNSTSTVTCSSWTSRRGK